MDTHTAPLPTSATAPRSARTLPATVATLALGPLPASVGRRVGRRVEVDVDAVREQLGAEASGRLLRYWRSVRSFRQGAPGRYLNTRRVIAHARLSDPKGGPRVYITEELAALRMLTGVGPVVEALLDVDRDLAGVRRRGEAFDVQVQREGNKTTVRMMVPAVGEWPAVLGGVVGPDEAFRQVTVVANHAGSRRSISHRLMEVEVQALEQFPAPEGD